MVIGGNVPRVRKALVGRSGRRRAPREGDRDRRGTAARPSETRQLLSFSRRQAIDPTVDPCRGERIEGAVQPILAEFDRDGGRARHRGLPADLWSVQVDSNELDLALVNLTLNARDAISPQGRIYTISARERRRLGGGETVKKLQSDFGTTRFRSSTPASAFRPTSCRKSSILFSPQSIGTRGRGSGCRRCTDSAASPAARRSRFQRAGTRHERDDLPAADRRGAPATRTSGRGRIPEAPTLSSSWRTIPRSPRSARPMLEEIGYTVRLAADARQALAIVRGRGFRPRRRPDDESDGPAHVAVGIAAQRLGDLIDLLLRQHPVRGRDCR